MDFHSKNNNSRKVEVWLHQKYSKDYIIIWKKNTCTLNTRCIRIVNEKGSDDRTHVRLWDTDKQTVCQ